MIKREASTARILGVGLTLLALWGLSLGLSYLSLGGAALPIALCIAAVKASLVLWFFMDLARERSSAVYAFLVAALMVFLLLAFMVADVLTRAPSPIS
jgi:cytochrome c oxidase subunit IV